MLCTFAEIYTIPKNECALLEFCIYLVLDLQTYAKVIGIHAAGSFQTYIHVSQNLKEVEVNLAVLFKRYPYLSNGWFWGPRMPLFLRGRRIG